VSGNTAIATTATADSPPSPHTASRYVGRFAPSPTGALHLGSLVAALGSYADARRAGGLWLLRMEDLDGARVLPGCADQMLRTLEAFGFGWDGAVEYQSRRLEHYRAALAQLASRGHTFECSCSRRELEGESGYPGTCREGPQRSGPTATRLRVGGAQIEFLDRLQGECRFSLAERGDVILRRRDDVPAYQLAVVVDDALQQVTDVVRGADLLDSTPWQIALQQTLGLPTPRYAHLPLILEPDGAKLAKSARSIALDPRHAGRQLFAALQLLQQHPPPELELEAGATLLDWVSHSWAPQNFFATREIKAPLPADH
jgi:glutamyl-Q tRNA(Asp) synthetase